MGLFHDRLAAVGDEGYGDTFADEITAAYDSDFNTAMAGATAKVDTTEAENAALRAELLELKATLFDLTRAQPAVQEEPAEEPSNDDPDNTDDPDDDDDSSFMK